MEYTMIEQIIKSDLVYNRNERLIIRELEKMVKNGDTRLSTFSEKDIRDIYALANNQLMPKYVQKGTIVVQNDVSKEDVEMAVENAIDIVFNNPKE